MRRTMDEWSRITQMKTRATSISGLPTDPGKTTETQTEANMMFQFKKYVERGQSVQSGDFFDLDEMYRSIH